MNLADYMHECTLNKLDEKLTTGQHLIKLKTVLGQISTQGQHCSLEKDIKTRVDLCIAIV